MLAIIIHIARLNFFFFVIVQSKVDYAHSLKTVWISDMIDNEPAGIK